jgi:hypothetical protein
MKRKSPAQGRAISTTPIAGSDCTDYCRHLRGRRSASWRLPVLDSGRADPWHYEAGERGYPEAAEYLIACGLTPAPNLSAMRSMWQDSPESRRVARIISERWVA